MHEGIIEIEGIEIYYRESRPDGFPVLLVHGNSLSSAFFRHQLEGEPGRRYRLVAIDLPGCGQSARPAEPDKVYTPAGLCRIISAAAAALGADTGIAAGHSLGGHLLLEAREQMPALQGRLIFGTPPLGIPPALGEAYLPNPAIPLAFTAHLDEEHTVMLAQSYTAPPVQKEVIEAIRQADPALRGGLGASVAAGQLKDETQIVATLDTALAIFHGEQDTLVNLDYFARLKLPTLWQRGVKCIAGAGHTPQYENPALFNALLMSFIESIAPADAMSNTPSHTAQAS